MVAMQFWSVRDLVRVTQGMERVMNDTLRLASEQTGFKRKDFVPPPGRAPYQRRVKVVSLSGNSRREGEVLFMEGVRGELDRQTLGDIPGVRLSNELVLWEDPWNRGDPPNHCV